MAEPKVRFRRDDGSSYPAWRTIPMSEVFTEISEKNHPELPVLSVQQGVGTVLRDSSDRNILYDKSNLKNYKAMKKDDYIIHLRTFEGGLECSNYDGISSPAYRILRSQAILPAAYRDYFRSYEFIHNKLAVSVVGIRDGKNIDMDTFWQIPMSVPSLEEQQKIADFLSSVDAVITASEQEVANLETQKKAVMKKIFSQEVRFKRTDGSEFPDWEENVVGEYLSDITYGFTNPMPDADEGPWKITAKDIVDGRICYETARHTTEDAYCNDLTDKSRPILNDILLTKDGTLGRVAIVRDDVKICINQSVALLRLKDNSNVDPLFFMTMLMSPVYQERMIADAGGGTIKHIYITKVDKMMCAIPCPEEQRLIADFLSDFDEAIAAAKKELELWKELKKGLLQQMFV